MINSVKFRINTDLQLLKYVDNMDQRQIIINEIRDLLDMISANESIMTNEVFINGECSDDEFYNNPIREVVKRIVKLNYQHPFSASDIVRFGKYQEIEITETIVRVGKFIQKYKEYFATEDEIAVETIRRGTASNLYSFKSCEYCPAEVQL